MAKHLTDEQKKRMIADYATLGSYSAVARKYRVSDNTVRRAVMSDPQTEEKCEQKRAENTEKVLHHLGKRAGKACEIIDLYMDYLADPAKLARANVRDLATALGIVVDKFTGTGPEIEKLRAEIAKLNASARDPRADKIEDDPITRSLKEDQENGLL